MKRWAVAFLMVPYAICMAAAGDYPTRPPEVATDVMSGRLDYAMAPLLPSTPLVRSGRLIALGITSPQRLPMLPDVPTIAEAALPGFVYEGWYGIFTPARTPREI